MVTTPEGRTKIKIRELLLTAGAYYHMPVQNGMGKPTLDYVGCHKGRFFAVEAKAPGKVPTPRQEMTIREIQKASGIVFVIDGVEGSYAALESWLR